MKNKLFNYMHYGRKAKMLMLTGILWLSAFTLVFAQQTNTVTGVVYDESNATLPGATIMVKGTTIGALSDLEGKFTLQAPATATTLVVSFIGMVSQEIAITKEPIKITFLSAATDLEQVVVVGYSSKKKSLVTGAISSVKAKDLQTTSSSRADQAIQGKTAGVMVLTTSGSPGAGSKIRIRGTNSNSNSNPLFIVDGMKTGDINNIDPGDIESMEVLKDAASSAIYGTEGANGVILITTKSGKSGKGVVNYDFQFGMQSVRTDMKMMNASQYKQWMTESGTATQDRFNVDTDWLSETFETAPMQKHYLSFSMAYYLIIVT